VDRDPSEFDDVLNFMRDGKLRCKKLLKRTKLEFAFYGIIPNELLTHPLQNAIRTWLPNRKLFEVYSGYASTHVFPIVFYFILFYFILFYFISFYFISFPHLDKGAG
jgi:hypothetical protein